MSIIQKWNSISLVKRIVCGLIIGAILGLLIPQVKVYTTTSPGTGANTSLPMQAPESSAPRTPEASATSIFPSSSTIFPERATPPHFRLQMPAEAPRRPPT